MTIDHLRDQGLVEAVVADPQGALVILDACERHLSSANAIASSDPSGAFQLAYDAARKAVNAHMLAHAVAVLAGDAGTAVGAFDRMRQRRNRTEYGTVQIEAAEVTAALGNATAIVAVFARR